MFYVLCRYQSNIVELHTSSNDMFTAGKLPPSALTLCECEPRRMMGGCDRPTLFGQVIRTLEEPTAAALAFGLHRKPNVNHILVYDLGGGTLDVSLLFVNDGSVEVLGSDGDDNLGGKAMVNLYVLHQRRAANFKDVFQGDSYLDALVFQRYSAPNNTAQTRFVALFAAQIDTRRSRAKSMSRRSGFCTVDRSCRAATAVSSPVKIRFHVHLSQPGSDFDQCVAHVLEHKLEGSIVTLEEAETALSCGFASPTCAIHNLYPLSEGLRRLLTDGETATMECMMLPDEARRRNLESPDSNKEVPSGDNPKAGNMGGHPAHRSDGGQGGRCGLWKSFSLDLARAEYEHSCASLFDRGVAPVDRLLDYLDLRVDEIDEVVMVGGMTRTPRVRSLLKSHLGVGRLNVDIDPDVVVAYGAATIAH